MLVKPTITCLFVLILEFQGSYSQKLALEKCKEFGKLYERQNEFFPGEINQIICNSRNVTEEQQFATFGEFPYMAILRYKTVEGKSKFHCSGVLISPNYLLAPAYCAISPVGGPVSARFGYLNVTDENLGPYGQEVQILNLKVHPNYSHKDKKNAIALVRLERNVKYNKYVHPICLQTEDIDSGEVTSSGWDLITRKSNDNKMRLLKRVFNIYEESECKEFYKEFQITDEQLCAGPVGDKCTGLEPNGIIQVKNDEVHCMDSLVGIINYGRYPCAETPDVYTKIAPHVKWIESHIWE